MQRSVYNSGIRIALVQCSIPDHEGQPLISICLQCHNTVCCAVCLDKTHATHKTESIRGCLKSVRDSNLNVKKDTERSRLGDSISSIQYEIREYLMKTREDILRELDIMDRLIINEFEIIDANFSVTNELANIDSVMSDIKTAKELQVIINKIKSILPSSSSKQSYQDQFTESLSKKKKTLSSLLDNVAREFSVRARELSDQIGHLHQFSKQGSTLQCDHGHNLVKTISLGFPYQHGEYFCDQCGRKGVVTSITPVWHCEPCGYDLCEICCAKRK